MSIIDKLAKINDRMKERYGGPAPTEAADTRIDAALEQPALWGRRALWLGVSAFIIWAFFAPLGEGVPASGTVKVEGERKAVQHLRGGVVEEILVKEGDRVTAGQPLVRLNQSQAQAQHGIVDGQLISLFATESRLQAERLGARVIEIPEFLALREDNPQVKEAMQVQTHLFRARQAALEGEISILNQNISGVEQLLRGLDAQEKARAEQLRLFSEELEALKPLAEQGFVPRNRLFEVERAVAYLNGQRSEGVADIGRARSQISELRLKKLQVRETFRKEVETELADVQRKITEFRERRIATQDDLDRIVLRAPVGGTVVDLAVHTEGGVVQPGQNIMDIVPEGQALVIEARIPPHLIEGVVQGQEADIRFLAFDQSIIPNVTGKLIYVSADSITDPRTEIAYFVGRVVPDPQSLEKLGRRSIQPGMPADVVIKTGERSFVGYLLKPLLSRLYFAFTER